jgi:hypothetical protein
MGVDWAQEAQLIMIRRNTWIVLGVFILLLALAIFWDRIPALNPPEATPTAMPVAESLFEFTADEVQQLTLNGIAGETAVYQLDEEGTWKLTTSQDTGGKELDSEEVSYAVEQLARWQPLASIEAITELQAIGLIDPATRITVTLSDGEEVQVGVGDETVTGSGYYVHVGGQQPQIISITNVEEVTNLLYSPPMLEATPTPNAEPTQTLPAPTLSPALTPTAE